MVGGRPAARDERRRRMLCLNRGGVDGPVRPLRSLGNLRVGVLPSDLRIIGASCVVVNTERGWWDEWLALVVRPNLAVSEFVAKLL